MTTDVRHRFGDKGEVQPQEVSWNTVFQIAFWGTVIWGFLRLISFFFSFTPYGVRVFSRPLLGMAGEDTRAGVAIGAIMLFGVILVAAAVYKLLLSKVKMWWIGILYGLVLFVPFGLFFRMGMWSYDTLSTELLWFITLGMFIAMTISAEAYGEE